jgi:transcriptional regulator with XRE-family HTH domain
MLGDKIKEYRIRSKLTQQQLASKAFISIHTLRSLEQNKPNYHPSEDVICHLAQALGIPEISLLPGQKTAAALWFFKKRWLIFSVVFIVIAVIAWFLLIPAKELGALDFNRACEKQYASISTGVTAKPEDPKNVWSWDCILPEAETFGLRHDIDTFEACKEQYASPYALSRYHNKDDAFSWHCYMEWHDSLLITINSFIAKQK